MAAERAQSTKDLYEARVERLRERAARHGIDALLLSDPATLAYLAGVGHLTSAARPLWLVAPARGPCTLVVPGIEAPSVGRASWIADQREWVEWPDPTVPDHWAPVLVAVLRERGHARGRLGVEFGALTVSTLDVLRAHLPDAELLDAGRLAGELRRRKDAVELAILRTAGRIVAVEAAAARAVVAEGVPEYELTLAARAAGTRAAAEAIGPDRHLVSPVSTALQILGAGPERSAMPHARASTYRLRRGDVVQLCFCNTVYLTYNLGFDRPVVTDERALSGPQRRLLDVALAAHDAALAVLLPGVRAREVHAAAIEVMAVAGLLPYRRHRTGRGVGTAWNESPELRESDETRLEPGMTLTVEPGIYVPEVGGARFGDTIAVTETGYELLTPAPYGWGGR